MTRAATKALNGPAGQYHARNRGPLGLSAHWNPVFSRHSATQYQMFQLNFSVRGIPGKSFLVDIIRRLDRAVRRPATDGLKSGTPVRKYHLLCVLDVKVRVFYQLCVSAWHASEQELEVASVDVHWVTRSPREKCQLPQRCFLSC